MNMLTMLCLFACTWGSIALASLKGVTVTRVSDRRTVDLGSYVQQSSKGKTLLIFGTYAADFNAIEYGQRLRYYMPELKKRFGVCSSIYILVI